MNYDEMTLKYMNTVENYLEAILVRGDPSSDLLEAVRYSLLSGGKRIRGILTLASSELVSGSIENALPAAAAIEMVHCSSLIHDDLPCMDDDDYRRGKPSCHKAFGEAMAVLAGDVLLTLPYQVLGNIQNAEIARACMVELSRAAGHKGMMYGQELDLAAEGMTLTPSQLTKIHQYKTGAMITAAVRMGAIAGGADAAQLKALTEYSAMLGLTFQIVDDILDVTANETEFGKPTGSDAKQNKATAVTMYGLEASKALAVELTAKSILCLNTQFKHSEYLTELSRHLLSRTK